MDNSLRMGQARQNLHILTPAKGQLHRLVSPSVPPEIFVLIVDVGDERCDVLPGSMDAVEAAYDDIVLPPQVFGDYVMISVGHPVSLLKSVLGEGFAVLREPVFQHVRDAVSRYVKGERELGFVRGYPYVSEFDERIAYHESLSHVLSRLQEADSEESAVESVATAGKLRQALAWLLAHRVPFVQAPVFKGIDLIAAAPALKAVDADCRIEGFAGIVNARYLPGEKKLHLRVFGSDGNRSEDLAGWTVLGTGDAPLGEIAGADFSHVFATEFDGAVALMDRQGRVYLLQEAKGE